MNVIRSGGKCCDSSVEKAGAVTTSAGTSTLTTVRHGHNYDACIDCGPVQGMFGGSGQLPGRALFEMHERRRREGGVANALPFLEPRVSFGDSTWIYGKFQHLRQQPYGRHHGRRHRLSPRGGSHCHVRSSVGLHDRRCGAVAGGFELIKCAQLPGKLRERLPLFLVSGLLVVTVAAGLASAAMLKGRSVKPEAASADEPSDNGQC